MNEKLELLIFRAMPNTVTAMKEGYKLLQDYNDSAFEDEVHALLDEQDNPELQPFLALLDFHVTRLSATLGIEFDDDCTLQYMVERIKSTETIPTPSEENDVVDIEEYYAREFAKLHGTHAGYELARLVAIDKLNDLKMKTRDIIGNNETSVGTSFVRSFTHFVAIADNEIIPELKGISKMNDFDIYTFSKTVDFSSLSFKHIAESILLSTLLDSETIDFSYEDRVTAFEIFIDKIPEEKYLPIKNHYITILKRFSGF